jgi:hypothetical protein
MAEPLIPAPPLPPGTDLPGLLRSMAQNELRMWPGLAVAARAAADEIERLRAAAGSATPTEPAFVFEGTFDALAASRGWWDHSEYRWVIYAYTAAAGSATPTLGEAEREADVIRDTGA